MGLGNLLYLLLWAAQGRDAGEQRFVRVSSKLAPWLDEFPSLRALTLVPGDVRFTDQRVSPWREAAAGGVPPHRGYEDAERSAFIHRYLLPGVALEPRDHMTINVRRGDYYSDPSHMGEFGFDIDSYLRVALEESCRTDTPRALKVVSDDPEWCRVHLAWLNDIAHTTVSDPSDTPAANLWDVASSRRLVITNSTFSYWGAYMSNELFGDNYDDVWAPRFFSRTRNGGRGWQLDERWSIVESLPHGWSGNA